MELKIPHKIRILFFFLLIFIPLTSSYTQEIPILKSRVNDYALILSESEKNTIESYLASVETQTGTQVAVLTVKTAGNQDIETYSMNVAEQWKLGQKGKDNGCLLVIIMDTHDIRIEVGYGLEDKLTDTACGLIIRNKILPSFRTGQFSEGIFQGVQAIGGKLGATDKASTAAAQSITDEKDNDSVPAAQIFLIIAAFFIFSIRFFPLFSFRHRSFFGPTFHDHDFFGPGGGFNGTGGSSGNNSFHGGGGNFGGGGASGHW